MTNCTQCRIRFTEQGKPIYAKLEQRGEFMCCVECGSSYGNGVRLMSDGTRPATQAARDMLAAGINIQATGEATNAIVTGMLTDLFAHIDELEADLNCAVAVGRYAARTPIPPVDGKSK